MAFALLVQVLTNTHQLAYLVLSEAALVDKMASTLNHTIPRRIPLLQSSETTTNPFTLSRYCDYKLLEQTYLVYLRKMRKRPSNRLLMITMEVSRRVTIASVRSMSMILYRHLGTLKPILPKAAIMLALFSGFPAAVSATM